MSLSLILSFFDCLFVETETGDPFILLAMAIGVGASFRYRFLACLLCLDCQFDLYWQGYGRPQSALLILWFFFFANFLDVLNLTFSDVLIFCLDITTLIWEKISEDSWRSIHSSPPNWRRVIYWNSSRQVLDLYFVNSLASVCRIFVHMIVLYSSLIYVEPRFSLCF